MKIAFIAFTCLIFLSATMLFGGFALSRLIRWFGWEQDWLAALALISLLLLGTAMIGWQTGVEEDKQTRKKVSLERSRAIEQ